MRCSPPVVEARPSGRWSEAIEVSAGIAGLTPGFALGAGLPPPTFVE